MKTIGLIGGMSWESTIPYYRLINEGVKQRLGGLHSASLLLHSVDFHEIEACQSSGEWDKAGEIPADAALGLERAGRRAFCCVPTRCTKWPRTLKRAVRCRSCTSRTPPDAPFALRECRAWPCWAHVTPWSRISIAGACTASLGLKA